MLCRRPNRPDHANADEELCEDKERGQGQLWRAMIDLSERTDRYKDP